MQSIHQPIRVFVLDMDRCKAYDTVILDEAEEFSSVLGCTRFAILPCMIGGRPFCVARPAVQLPFMTVSMVSEDGKPVSYGNTVVLGREGDEHRGLTDEEVVHVQSSMTMTILFSKTHRTIYVINDAAVLEVGQ